eukprot:s254_g20.t1
MSCPILSHKSVTPLGGKKMQSLKALTSIGHTEQHKLPQDPNRFHNCQSDAWLLVLWNPGCALLMLRSASAVPHCSPMD